MGIRIAICDDNEVFLDWFQIKLESAFSAESVDCSVEKYNDGRNLMEDVESYDAVFLDIDMPEINGMEIADKINKGKKIPIVFLTAHDEFVYSSFRFQPLRFIRKACVEEELGEAVRGLWNEICKQNDKYSITFQSVDGEVTLLAKNIMYVEIFDHWANVCTDKEEVHKCYSSLGEYEKQLAERGFVRVHRCYLVNCRFIYEIKREAVILDNGKEIIMSRHRAKEVRDKFQKVMRER